MTASKPGIWDDAIRLHDRKVFLSVLALGIGPESAREIAQAAWTGLHRPPLRLPPWSASRAAIDLDVRDLPAADVIRRIGEQCGGLNTVLPDTIDFKITLQLKHVPCDEAFKVLLESRGLWYRYNVSAALLRIAPRKELDLEDQDADVRARTQAELAIGNDDLPEGPAVDLDFKNAPIRDVLQYVAASGGVNIVVPDTIDARVIVTATKVPWNQILPVILESHGLWYRYREHGKIVRVAPRIELDVEDSDELARRRAASGATAPSR